MKELPDRIVIYHRECDIIEIPTVNSRFIYYFMIFWLIFWSYGFYNTFLMVLNFDGFEYIHLYIYLWLTIWIIAGILAFNYIFWHIFGTEYIKLEEEYLHIKRGPFGDGKKYQLDKILDLKVIDRADFKYATIEPFGGKLQMLYQGKWIKFAKHINYKEAMVIHNYIRVHLRKMAVEQ